jgi:arylsulfatase A-like enzyme
MDSRPNILLITTDQQRFDTIRAAGNPHIRTPHLDWLCDTGIRFSNAYTDCPICIAARATIMTGRHGWRQGLTANRADVRPIRADLSLPGLLTRAGYQTRAQGKMHFVPNRCHYGFEEMEILEDYYRRMAARPDLGAPMDHGLGQNEMDVALSTVDESNSLTHWTVDRSIDFLETRDPTRPFFLWTSFAKPHPPFDPCRNYWELYRDAEVPAPVHGDWSADATSIPAGLLEPTLKLNMLPRLSEAQIRDARRAYYACITQIDYNLGILLARLREMDLFRRTLILFTSDHGEMLGDHHLGAKTIPHEGSARVPLILRPPQADWEARHPRAGSVCPSLVCLADLLPTCLAFAGVPCPAEAKSDGLNLFAAAEGEARRDVLFGECEAFHFVRQGPWKYVFEDIGGTEQLFNLDDDPMERNELLRAGGHVERHGDLQRRLIGRLQATDHPAVRDGRLVARYRDPRDAIRPNAWPGFHSRAHPDEVAH